MQGDSDERLDVRGQFWLPESPDRRVAGLLTFSYSDGGRLELIAGGLGDSPGQLPSSQRPSGRIVGQVRDQYYTLDNCFELHSSSGWTGVNEQTFHVGQILAGAAYESGEPLMFDAVAFGLDNLTQWVGRSGMTQSRDDSRFTLTCEILPTLEVRLPGFQLTLGQTIGSTGDSPFSRTLTEYHRFCIEFEEARPLTDVVDLASDLQDLVSIATNRVAAFRSLQVSHQEQSQVLSDGQPVRNWMSFHVPWLAAPSGRRPAVSEYDMAFTFDQLGGMEAVGRWLASARRYRSHLGAVMATRYRTAAFVEDRIIHRVAALEDFHREYSRGKASLIDRLVALANLAGDPFTELVGDVQAACNDLKDQRHNVGHHLGRPLHTDTGPAYHLAEVAYWLFALCLLRTSEVSAAAYDNLCRSAEFRWLAGQLRQRSHPPAAHPQQG